MVLSLFMQSQHALCQSESKTVPFGIYQVYPPLSLTKDQLNSLSSIPELNRFYKPSWIQEYLSTAIKASVNGTMTISLGESEMLTEDQIRLIKSVDTGSEISVDIKYIPENNLKVNEARDIHFSFTIEPEVNARYPIKEKGLTDFIQSEGLNQIKADSFDGFDITVVQFTIDEEGQVTDPFIFWSSEDESTDSVLLNTICKMPKWDPAKYANGHRIKQDYVLIVGNMENCMVHTLNIRKEDN